LCYNFTDVETLLNMQKVKSDLGVRDDLKYHVCSSEVQEAMMQDWMRNLEVGIPALLEDGIKLLVYVGEEDLICNWLGNSSWHIWEHIVFLLKIYVWVLDVFFCMAGNLRWVQAMQWSGQGGFGMSPPEKFVVDGAEAGSFNTYGPLTFLKVCV